MKLEKYIRTVEVFQGAGNEIETKVMGIMTFVTVEIIVTDLDNIKDQLQHVQVRHATYLSSLSGIQSYSLENCCFFPIPLSRCFIHSFFGEKTQSI